MLFFNRHNYIIMNIYSGDFIIYFSRVFIFSIKTRKDEIWRETMCKISRRKFISM